MSSTSVGVRLARAIGVLLTSWPVVALSPLLIVPVGLASPARADGTISDTEFAYIQMYGASAVCPTIDDYPTPAGVLGVEQGIEHDGFTADDAVDIINVSVHEYCPSHWPLLVAIGKAARGAAAGTLT